MPDNPNPKQHQGFVSILKTHPDARHGIAILLLAALGYIGLDGNAQLSSIGERLLVEGSENILTIMGGMEDLSEQIDELKDMLEDAQGSLDK